MVIGFHTARSGAQSKRGRSCASRAGGRRNTRSNRDIVTPGSAAHQVPGSPRRPETSEKNVGPSARPSVPEEMKMAMARWRFCVMPYVALDAACG